MQTRSTPHLRRQLRLDLLRQRAIAAPIIGGVFGGRGNVVGVFGGVMLLTVIQVGLAIIAVHSFSVGMIGGVMISIAVALDAIRVRCFQ